MNRLQLLAVIPQVPETYFNFDEIFRQIGLDQMHFNLENQDHCADDDKGILKLLSRTSKVIRS